LLLLANLLADVRNFLCFVSVANSIAEQLGDLCQRTKNGKLIDVDDKEGVEHAISAAFVEIGNMMEVSVETYNFKAE
jgi:hypothetical protein